MRIRIINFTLAISRDDYIERATAVAPEFAQWPGLLSKWWIGDAESGTYGGVYLFATREDADRSRDTDMHRNIFENPALTNVTMHEYDLLDAPTALTTPEVLAAG
jgi:hypothetical protein